MSTDTTVAIVANFKYLKRYANNFFKQLRTNGNFNGEVILITSKITPTFIFKAIRNDKNIRILRFNKIKFSNQTKQTLSNLNTGDQPNRNNTKNFQWAKLNLFREDLKEWKYIFYLDINMHIHFDLSQLFKIQPNNKLLARNDSYPDFVNTLSTQFDTTHDLYKEMEKNFNLNTKEYFQTGILYFDTNIISKNIYKEIINLVEKYPITVTNEQGILNIYFKYIYNLYEELPIKIGELKTYYYWLVPDENIIITKQNREKYK